jgi:acyl CoA:acetate/3-ketoacid CoA transferase beta subunit
LKGTFFIFFVLIGLGVGAQSKVAFHAPDSMTFLLSLNDVFVNNVPVSDIAIVPVNAGKTKVKMTFAIVLLLYLQQKNSEYGSFTKQL